MPLITLIAAGAFIIILVLLHFLKPELDPSWRMISEYEIGRFGWLMRIAFVCLSAAVFSLVAVLGQHASLAAEILLGIAALGPLGAAIFETDPITTSQETKTTASHIHDFFGVLFILGFPIAVTVTGGQAKDPLFSAIKSWLPWLSVMVWVGFTVFIGAIVFYARSRGKSGEQVKIGWPNRIMMLTYLAWLVIIARAVW